MRKILQSLALCGVLISCTPSENTGGVRGSYDPNSLQGRIYENILEKGYEREVLMWDNSNQKVSYKAREFKDGNNRVIAHTFTSYTTKSTHGIFIPERPYVERSIGFEVIEPNGKVSYAGDILRNNPSKLVDVELKFKKLYLFS